MPQSTTFQTLAEMLLRRADAHPDRIALSFLGDGETLSDEWTYGDLLAKARGVAAFLSETTQPGDRVLLAYPSGLQFIAALFGCFLSRRIAVPVYPPDPMRLQGSRERLTRIAQNSDAACVLTSELLLGLLQEPDFVAPHTSRHRWHATDRMSAAADENLREALPRRQDLAMLQYTSGSTSQPRGVMLTHDNLLANLRMVRVAMDMSEATICVTWLPLYHDMGLIGTILEPLFVGGRSIVLSPLHFIERPQRWLEAIDRYRGTFAASPNFGYELCIKRTTEEERGRLDLSSWRLACNGAEPVRADTLQRFSEAFRAAGFRAASFYPCYGLAEASVFISGGHPDTYPAMLAIDLRAFVQEKVARPAASDASPEETHSLVSCGKTVLKGEIRIVDPDSCEPKGEDEIGEVWLAGPHLCGGYWHAPEENEALFGTVAGEDASMRYLRTGDLGFMHEGELYITGRIKDLCIINGQNYFAHDLERSIEAGHPAVRPGGACVIPRDEHLGGVLAIVETRDDADEDGRTIVRAIAKQLDGDYGVPLQECVLVPPRSVIKTPSGKKARWATREALVEDRLAILHRWQAIGTRPARQSAAR